MTKTRFIQEAVLKMLPQPNSLNDIDELYKGAKPPFFIAMYELFYQQAHLLADTLEKEWSQQHPNGSVFFYRD